MNGVRSLHLKNSQLNGTIPIEASAACGLFANAGIVGKLPGEMALLTNIQDLQIHYTSLETTIPTALVNMESLKNFLLDETKLTGVMPEEA